MKMKQKPKNLRESAIEIREGKACLINCKAQVQSKPISFERSSIDLRRAFSYSKILILKLWKSTRATNVKNIPFGCGNGQGVVAGISRFVVDRDTIELRRATMEGFSNMKEMELAISSKQIGWESFEVKNATSLIDGEGNNELDLLDGWDLRGAIRRGSIDNNLNFCFAIDQTSFAFSNFYCTFS